MGRAWRRENNKKKTKKKRGGGKKKGTGVWQTLGKKKRGLEPGKLGKKITHLHIYTHIHIGRHIQVSTMGRKPRV